jgi:small redox-active disulfide protein 2
MMKIEVLGPGCPRCANVEENVKKALLELKKEAEIVKITDINTMIEKGVIQTPTLIINGKIIIQGKIPTVEQIKEIIQREG